MKMTKFVSLGLIIGVFVFVSGTAWSASLKIAYFDIQTVLDKSRWGQQAKQEFNLKKQKIQTEMEAKAKQFKSLREEYEKKSSILDENARAKKAKELLGKQQEGEKALMESNAELNKLSNELTAPIVDKILEISTNIGKKEKYDFVIEVGKGGIVYANDDYDLTKKIIDELNKVSPRK
ncbi:MAG: OmpH family outer membrane protein [Desulforhabdus sp.]|jgi:outer membrane protein|nr:OmpH family outer membrane protein [Desulforhabdus sp.]